MKTHIGVCALAGLVLTAGSLGSQLLGQGIQFGQAAPQDIFLQTPRALQRLLNEGKSAIAEGRYSDGVAALGAILQDDGDTLPEDLRGQDFFLRPGNGEVVQSVKGRAVEELNQLPEEGRKNLEIQFGVKARQLLDQAIAQRDMSKIANIARKFVHTDAGYDAMLLESQYKLTNGYPLAAASILRSLLSYPAARNRLGVGLAESAVVCWLQVDNSQRALATLEQAAKDFPGESLTIRGQQIALENKDAIVKALQNELSKRAFNRSASSWLVTGGSPSRNATNQVSLPLPNEEWVFDIHSSRPEGMALQEAEEVERKNGRLMIPRFDLRMIGDTVVSRSNDSTIVGINLQTGLFTWQRPTSATVAPLKETDWMPGDSQLSKELKNRIWGSNAFGRISCDNQRCFHVVQKPIDLEEVRGLGVGLKYASTTRLECVSLYGGKIVWSLGGADSDEPSLATAFFLGPPLPYAGQLYSLIEINGQIELIVLDPATGRLQWRQQLATSPQQIEYDQFRQSHGLMPSISDDIIVCPTGSGGIVAIDLLTHTFRWGINFGPTQNRGSTQFGGGFGMIDYEPLDRGWFDEGLIIENGMVAFTPPESDWLICYDLLTGEELMRRSRASAAYVAGIFDGGVILVNGNSVQSLERGKDISALRRATAPDPNRQTGRPRSEPRLAINSSLVRWETNFPERMTLVGRGIWQDGFLMLPLSGGRIIQVELKTGKIVDSTTVSKPLGNLYVHKDTMLSVGPTSITAFYTRERLQATVAERLTANPKDNWAMNHQAQLLLAEKKTKQAFQLLMDSYTSHPDDVETQFFLIDAMLAGLQEDFGYFSQYAQQLDAIVLPEIPQRVRYLQLLAKGLIDKEDYFGAFKRLWEIMSERRVALIQGVQVTSSQVPISSNHSVDLDAWFSVELGRLFEKCSPDQQAQIRSWVDAEFSKLNATVVTVRRQMLRHMLHLPAAEQLNLDLAKSLLELTSGSGNDQVRIEQTNAEQLLKVLIGSKNAELQATARRMLYDVPQSDANLPRMGDVKDGVWPTGMLQPNVDGSGDAFYNIGRPVEVVGDRFGRPSLSIANLDRLIFTDVNGKTVDHLGYRPATGDIGSTSYMRLEVQGGLILIETASELIAIDYYRRNDQNQTILWRFSLEQAAPREQLRPRNLDQTLSALGIQNNKRLSEERAFVQVGPLMGNAKIVQLGSSIVGLDPYSGKKIWSREGYNSDAKLVGEIGSNTLSIVNPVKGQTELIDVRDGKLTGNNSYLVEEMSQRYKEKGKKKWESWFSSGKWLVDYAEEANSEVRLRVWSPQDEKLMFDSRFPNTTRVSQSQRDKIAIAVPTGQLQLVDLLNEQVTKFDVPVEQELDRISLMKFANHLVVISSVQSVINRTAIGQNELLAAGHIYCIDANTKQLAWSEPGRLYNLAIPVSQPRNSPYFVAIRSNVGSKFATVVLLDLRTGKIAQTIDGPKLEQGIHFSMELRPNNHEIALMVGDKNYRFRATNEAPPPEPIINYGFQNQRETQLKRDPTSLFDQ
ncbi:MAG: PQQ-binding-like beta-propeller repeat protein [Pirellulales bacterium]